MIQKALQKLNDARAVFRFLEIHDCTRLPEDELNSIIAYSDIGMLKAIYRDFADFEELTVRELRAIASSTSLPYYSWKNKEELVRALRARAKETNE